MEKVKVSIIVPVYNTEKFLKKCLNSLINQTLKEIEIICVDDGSTDNSPTILNDFMKKDNRIKVIHQENSGVSVSRNRAVSVAQGEYIGFVDSDDWVDEDFFEKLYNASQKYNSDIIAGDFFRCGKILRTKKLKYKKEQIFTTSAEKIKAAYIPKYNYVCNKIYRRESLLKLNIPFEIGRYYEDMIWLVKIIYSLNGFITVPNTFYYYRRNVNSIVFQKSDKHKKDYKSAKEEMLNYMKDHNIPILVPYKKNKKIKISFLGFDILNIEFYYPSTTKYKLFGFFTILTVKQIQ